MDELFPLLLHVNANYLLVCDEGEGSLYSVDWNGPLDYWNGVLEHWNGLLEHACHKFEVHVSMTIVHMHAS